MEEESSKDTHIQICSAIYTSLLLKERKCREREGRRRKCQRQKKDRYAAIGDRKISLSIDRFLSAMPGSIRNKSTSLIIVKVKDNNRSLD